VEDGDYNKTHFLIVFDGFTNYNFETTLAGSF